MNLAVRAALLNAILFPGWGEVYLKSYKKGFLIIAAVVAGILSIVWSIIQTALHILKISPFKKGAVTLFAIFQLAIDAIRSINFSYLVPIVSSIILLWIISIIDAYQIGKEEMAKINYPNKSNELH